MSVSVCPVATVNAPVERVWRLLSDPSAYALWGDVEIRSIEPEGPATKGQRVYAYAKALGMRGDVRIDVEGVDWERRQLDLTTNLPLGITVRNRIGCVPIDSVTCRVSFG
jgi:hypothetical protein